LILEPTGTFSQTVTWNQLMTYDTGEYNIIQNAIHFTVTHHEPTENQGQPLSWATSFTYYVYPINATSMTVEDRTMNTRWTMVKTGP
jgi:fructose-1,6-bisphosphatase